MHWVPSTFLFGPIFFFKFTTSSVLDCSPNLVSPPRTPLGPLNTTPSNSGREDRTPQEERHLKKVSKRNHRGETPLHCSAIKGNVALVRKLLRMGADPNTQDNAGNIMVYCASAILMTLI